jgi:hypothetical protein
MLAPALRAETVAGGERRSGLELFVSSVGAAFYDRDVRVRGAAYEVLGLATLRALPGARVRIRCGGAWAATTAGPRGGFEVAVPVPEHPDFDEDERPRLEIEVSQGPDHRTFEVPVELMTPLGLVARTDRNEYEPGETVHLWARVFDVRTGRPLSGVPVRFVPGSVEIEAVTSGAGVATADLPIPAHIEAVNTGVTVAAGREALEVTSSLTYRVSDRPVTDLFVTVSATPETVAPGEEVAVRVLVRSPSGFPVRGATVELTASGHEAGGVTGDDGSVTVRVRAPEYTESRQGSIAINGRVHHPGYGSAGLHGSFGVSPPASLTIEVVAARIVPEVRERLILSVLRDGGRSPAEGTTIEVRGAAIEGGRAVATVDRHGLVSVPVRATATTYALHVGDSTCGNRAATSIEIEARGDIPQREQLCIPVLERALVAPTVARPAVSPGDEIEVGIARRPAAAGRPVVVELLAWETSGFDLVASVVAAPTQDRVVLRAPGDRLDVFFVRARPLSDPGETDSDAVERTGALDVVLVRPDPASFPELELDRDVYTIRSTARMTIVTPGGAPRSHVAVLVRDLAQHQGETSFAEHFLRGALERAVLDPSTPESDLLVRAALADFWQADIDEDVNADRDPFRLAVEHGSEAAGRWMTAVERLLDEALAAGTVAEITEGEGADRRFVADVVALAAPDEVPRTLGDGEVTVDMLTEVDPGFTFETVARRVARKRLVFLLGTLLRDLDPDGTGEDRGRRRSSGPPERWLSELVRRGVVAPSDLLDPWGGVFALRRTGRTPRFTIAAEAEGYELVSPGPDGRIGTADDVRDPLARVVPEGTLYARVSGEDRLVAQLSALSPGDAALQALLEAYQRLNEEALEELAGEALTTGYGHGSGEGYGYGGLGLRGRSGRAPSIRCGTASVLGHSLAGIVRQEFPATLLFVPEADIDPSGRTGIEIPLAEAPTTYIVEVVLWRDDGWVWSASTNLRVDMEIMVDAPVPSGATVGDDIVLPLRVANRTKIARTVRLAVTGSPELDLEPVEAGPVEVPAEDAVEVSVTVSPRRTAKGALTVAAYSPAGDPLDAASRPIVVRHGKRRARDEAAEVLRGGGGISLVVPAGAEPRGLNRVIVAVGPAIFRRGEHASWSRWLDRLLNDGSLQTGDVTRWETERLVESGDPFELARVVSSTWLSASVDDRLLDRVIEVLTDHVGGIEASGADSLRHLSRLLMLLAPAVRHADERQRLRAALRRLVRDLRVKVESNGALVADAPWLSARAAAALLWTAGPRDPGARALEFLERARAGVVTVGDDAWLEGGSDDSGDELFVASSLLALAEARVGRDDDAFRLVRSMARLMLPGGRDFLEVRGIDPEVRMMAVAAASALGPSPLPRSLVVSVDGQARTIDIEDSVGEIDARQLGEGGDHRVEVLDTSGAVVLLHVISGYTVDWDAPPPHVGPFDVRIEGTTGGLDDRSGLVLVVRNRVPSLVGAPVVEIDLPSGAEVDLEARNVMRRWTRGPIDVSADTLTLPLGPICPRGEVRVRLPWIWTTSGRLNGLGVMAYAADRPDAISIAPARRVEVVGGAP